MVFQMIYTKRHIDKACERQETFISNSNRSRKSFSSSLLLHMALRSQGDQQEQLPWHTVSKAFSLKPTVLSDAKEKGKISTLTKPDYYLLTLRAWLETSLKHLATDYGPCPVS